MDGYVLLVEDDENVAETMRMVLEDSGIRIRHADDIDRACHVFDNERPQVILLDYWLRGDTPQEFVQYVRRVSSTPIILVTAASSAEALAESLEIKNLVKKPFSIEDLLDKLKACLEATTARL